MEIKNEQSKSLLDYFNFGNGNTTSTSSSFDFQAIFESNKTNDEPVFQKDSQKYYLKDKVNNVKDKVSDKINNQDDNVSVENDTLEDKNIIDKAKDKISDKIEDKNGETKDIDETEKVGDKLSGDEVSDEEKIAKLAEYLNMSVEDVKKTLESLNMTIDSLSNPENIKDFLVQINGLTDRVDLLSIENVKEQITDIEAIANGDFEELSDEETAKIIDAAMETLDSEEANTTNEAQTNNQSQTNSESQTMTANDEAEATEAEIETVEVTKAFSATDEETPEVEVELDENVVENTAQQDATKDVNVASGAAAVSAVAAEQAVTSTVNTDTSSITGINGGLNTNNASFLNEVTKAATRASVDTDNILKQITEAMKVQMKSGVENEVKITLRPQHLGDVTLKIITENGIITAQFEAESQRVKEIIEANFNQLKTALEEQGVEVSSLEVNVSQHGESGSTGESNDSRGNTNTGTGGGGFIDEEIIEEVKVEESQVLGSTSSFRA